MCIRDRLRDVRLILLRVGQDLVHQFLAHDAGGFMEELNGVFHLLVQGDAEAKAEFGVVFKQGVGPGRSGCLLYTSRCV